MDFYQRKYPSFESKSPYWGQEFFFQINHNRSKSLTHYLRFNYEQNNTNSLTINISRKVRYHLEIEPHWTLKLRSRITLKNFNESSYGYLFYQDIKYNIPHTKLHLSTRYASFGIPLFEQTIYAYENDVLFFFNTPSYRGNGSKVYALLDFPIGNHLHFWLRMSQIVFENQKSISSGNNEIKGNRKTTIPFQTRLLF